MDGDDPLNLKPIFETEEESEEQRSAIMASIKPLAVRMQTLYYGGELTDVMFHVGESEEEFCAHRVVLATVSPVFRSMLFGDLFEHSKVISIPDVSVTAFRNVLRFAYDEAVHFKGVDDCLQTLLASDKYIIHALTSICVSHLRQRVDKENVLQILDCAMCLNIAGLMQPCFTSLDRSIDELLQSGAFLNISYRLWHLILERDKLPCRECELFRELSAWVEANRDEVSDENVKELLGLIHFSNMSIAALMDVVKPSGLLSIEGLLQAVLDSTEKAASGSPRRRRGLDDIPAHLQECLRTDLVLFYHTSHVSRRCPATEALYGCLDFRVNAKLLLRGYQLFGPKKTLPQGEAKQNLSAQLASRVECLSTREWPLRFVDEEAVLKPCSPLMNTYNYSFRDGDAALIYPNEWYRVSLNLSSPSYHSAISMCSEPVIRCTDTNVTFIFRKPGSWRKASVEDKLPYCSFLVGLHYQLLSTSSR